MLVNDEDLSAHCELAVLADPYKVHVDMFLGGDYIKSLYNCFNNSDIKYAFSNGTVFGEAGAQVIGPMHYNVWIAFNDALDNNKLFVHESTYAAIEFFEKNFPVTNFAVGICFVNSKYKAGVQYAKHLGFEIDEFTGSYFRMSRSFWRH